MVLVSGGAGAPLMIASDPFSYRSTLVRKLLTICAALVAASLSVPASATCYDAFDSLRTLVGVMVTTMACRQYSMRKENPSGSSVSRKTGAIQHVSDHDLVDLQRLMQDRAQAGATELAFHAGARGSFELEGADKACRSI